MRVKNIDTVSETYEGMLLLSSQEYTLDSNEIKRWAFSDKVLEAISSLKLQIGNDSEWITGTSNQINELTGILPKDESGNPIFSSSGVNEPSGKRARLKGMGSATIASSTTVEIDYLMEQLTYQGVSKSSIFDGVEYYSKNGSNKDTVCFSVVDKADGGNSQGVALGLYPQAYFDAYKDVNGHLVIEEFGDNVYVFPDTDKSIILYKSAIIPSLYIRTTYINNGASSCDFSINLYRHLVE